MENGRTKVWLSPINGGSYTRLRIVGTFPTALPVWEIRQLVERMSFFNGYPLECIVCGKTGGQLLRMVDRPSGQHTRAPP